MALALHVHTSTVHEPEKSPSACESYVVFTRSVRQRHSSLSFRLLSQRICVLELLISNGSPKQFGKCDAKVVVFGGITRCACPSNNRNRIGLAPSHCARAMRRFSPHSFPSLTSWLAIASFIGFQALLDSVFGFANWCAWWSRRKRAFQPCNFLGQEPRSAPDPCWPCAQVG